MQADVILKEPPSMGAPPRGGTRRGGRGYRPPPLVRLWLQPNHFWLFLIVWSS